MFRRIDHVALHVKDIKKSQQFYSDYFGFEPYFESALPSGVRIVYLKLGDTVLELVSDGSSNLQNMHFALQADNFDEAVAYLDQLPVLAYMPPHDTPAREPVETGWRRATYFGPDNEVIEIRG